MAYYGSYWSDWVVRMAEVESKIEFGCRTVGANSASPIQGEVHIQVILIYSNPPIWEKRDVI